MLDSELYRVTGDNQFMREEPQLRLHFDDLRPALDPPAYLLEKANKRLIATLPNSKTLLTHSKQIPSQFSNRNKAACVALAFSL
jgi:hypothetical protein